MKRQIKLGLLAVAITTLLMGLALPGLAGADVKVNVNAIEYDDSFIVVSILAVSSTRVAAATLDLWDLVGLTVSGEDQDLSTLNVEEHSFPLLRSKLWVVKIMSDGNLIIGNGDTVFAAVEDGSGNTLADDTATCGPGPSRFPRVTAICK